MILKNILIVFKNKFFYFFIFFIFAFPSFYRKLPVRIDISQQNSLPYSFWISYNTINYNTEFVLFKPPEKFISKFYKRKRKITYIKKIACKPGERLNREKDAFYCNNKKICLLKKYDLDNNKIKSFNFNGVIPKGKYFLLGSHPYSLDSRYFGFVDKKEFIRKEVPLF